MHFNVIMKDKYLELLKEVEDAERVEKKTPLQHRRLKRFGILEIGGVKKLVERSENNEIKYYLPIEDVYDVIQTAHIAVGHGGRDRMLVETSKKYANITKTMISIFLSMCQVCQEKKTKRKRGLVSKPILHSEINCRCQIDLIDYQPQPDGEYKFVMVYQDHLTKFVMLRPLMSKRAEEVAHHLTDIFLIFGGPCILQSDNGKEFANSVISELKKMWSELKIVHGKPRHSQSQGSVERANQDIENMLAAWMKDNQSTKWSEGLRYVQFMKNRSFHSGIKQSPYKAMFGIEPRVGLSTSSLPSDVLKDIQNEEDLRKVLFDSSEDEDEALENSPDANNSPISAEESIQAARNVARQNLEIQAKRMKMATEKSQPEAEVGDNVTIPIPDVDKAKGDLRNIIGVVLEKNDTGFYKIATKHGVLNKLYCRQHYLLQFNKNYIFS